MTVNPGRGRLLILDAARGVALLAMFVFHIVWDLGFFGLIPASWPDDPRFRAYGHTIATGFIMLAGIGLVLAAAQKPGLRPALIRIGRIALAAAGVSAITYAIFPDEFIFFGILHLIALASLCALPFLRAPASVVTLVALIALALPLLVS
ncbi:MAG: putative rane protein, partial [Hyphomicrobiales bacterium]|nr:putative rane protein [Hyphomicrobiales bacterium]